MAARAPSRKFLILIPLLTFALVATAWMGGILYWHFKLRSAVRTLEESSSVSGDKDGFAAKGWDAMQTLMRGGCRSMPYLIGALDEKKDLGFLSTGAFILAWVATFPGIVIAGETSTPELEERIDAWGVKAEDSPELRRVKCERMRAWWREHGPEYHQGWRFWSADCRNRH
jgi:hypothetical protein